MVFLGVLIFLLIYYTGSMNSRLLNRCIFILSLVGVAMAVYVLQSFLRQTPIVCISTGCELVRKNPASWPFGIPVPAFGLVGYTILAICAFLRTMNYKRRTMTIVSNLMLGVVIFGVSFVSWFTYTELFIIRGVCTWCAISTVNMYCIAVLVIFTRQLSHETHR